MMSHTAQKCVALQPCGMLWNATKKHVFVHLCYFHTYDSCPSFLHIPLLHTSLLYWRMSCHYSSILPVFSHMTWFMQGMMVNK